jgi:hypothetical protein
MFYHAQGRINMAGHDKTYEGRINMAGHDKTYEGRINMAGHDKTYEVRIKEKSRRREIVKGSYKERVSLHSTNHGVKSVTSIVPTIKNFSGKFLKFCKTQHCEKYFFVSSYTTLFYPPILVEYRQMLQNVLQMNNLRRLRKARIKEKSRAEIVKGS